MLDGLGGSIVHEALQRVRVVALTPRHVLRRGEQAGSRKARATAGVDIPRADPDSAVLSVDTEPLVVAGVHVGAGAARRGAPHGLDVAAHGDNVSLAIASLSSVATALSVEERLTEESRGYGHAEAGPGPPLRLSLIRSVRGHGVTHSRLPNYVFVNVATESITIDTW